MSEPLSEIIFVLWDNPLWQWAFYWLGLSFLTLFLIRLAVWIKLQWAYFNFVHFKAKARKNEVFHQYLKALAVVLLAGGLGFVGVGLLGAVVGGSVGLVLSIGWAYNTRRKTQQRLKQQLPLFLRALGSTLKAGYSVPQALDFVANEAEEPLRSKLRSGQRLLQIKQPLACVLADWRSALQVAEFSFLTDSLRLQAQSGGDLVSVCYSVASLLEERRQLEQDIRSFTAQGKMSGILMALLWPISLSLFAWLSPSHIEVLFSTTAGRVLLGLSLCLELVGFYFIWRLVRLKI